MTAPHSHVSSRQSMLLAALVAATGSIPLLVNFNSIALIFFVFACLIQQPWPVLKKKLSVPSLWMIPAAYFLWMCCSYFWDATGGFAVRDIERYAMLFFVPAALAVIPALPQKYLRITGAVFIVITIGVCLGCLIRSYEEYQTNHDSRVFFYHYLSQQMGLNAIFLSNYCLSGILWLMYDVFLQDRKRKPLAYVGVVGTCIFLFAMILLLSSKLVIFLTLFSLLVFLLYIGYVRKYFLKATVVILLFIAAGWLSIKNLGYVNWRMSVTSAKQYSGPQDDNNGLSIRMLMWQNAWHLIKQKPLLGYGVKGSRVKVIEEYRNENFVLGYTQGYHSHNQYLQTALMGGIPAFLLLMAMLLKMLWEGIRKKNVLLLLLLFHFMCQAVIESMFEVQQELVFYMLFLFLFYYHPPRTNNLQTA